MAKVTVISETLMEETWRRVAISTGAQATRLQELCGREQEELTGFVIAFTSDLRPEAMGVALYAYIVISEAFRKSGITLRRIKPGRIMRSWEANEAFVEAIKAKGRSSLAESAALTDEPAVFDYIVGALTEEEEDSVSLDDEELWNLLRILKTAMDCLHGAQKRGRT